MSPDLRSVYSCIPDNANNFIVVAMYLSIALYEKILQLQLKSIFMRYAVMNKILLKMSLRHFLRHCPDLKALMTFWGMESWDDLAIFSSNDLADAIHDIDELDTPICRKHLGYLGLPTGLCPLWKIVLPRHYHAGNHQIS